MSEREQPDLDHVRDAMREHDERAEGPADDQPERGEPRPGDDEPAEPGDDEPPQHG